MIRTDGGEMRTLTKRQKVRRLQRALDDAYDAYHAVPCGTAHDEARWQAWRDCEDAEVRLNACVDGAR